MPAIAAVPERVPASLSIAWVSTRALVYLSVPVQAVGAAFERVDAAIEAWQLNTVPEGEEDEDEEEDGPPEEDMTFLTGE
jgi:hypothetical protein